MCFKFHDVYLNELSSTSYPNESSGFSNNMKFHDKTKNSLYTNESHGKTGLSIDTIGAASQRESFTTHSRSPLAFSRVIL